MSTDERRMQKVFELYLEERKVDPSAVCIFFTYADGNPGYKLTNSAKRRLQHPYTTANNNNQQTQRRHTSEVTQTARRRHRPPATVLVDQMPGSAKNKRKRLGTASPTSPHLSPTMPATTTSTPEVIWEKPQTKHATPNTSSLPNVSRQFSDDLADADNVEVTKSNFFHDNKFSILANSNDSDGNSDNSEIGGSDDDNGTNHINSSSGNNNGNDDPYIYPNFPTKCPDCGSRHMVVSDRCSPFQHSTCEKCPTCSDLCMVMWPDLIQPPPLTAPTPPSPKNPN